MPPKRLLKRIPSPPPEMCPVVLELLRYPEFALVDGSIRRVIQQIDPLRINGGKRDSLLGLTEGFYAGKWQNHEYKLGEGSISTGDPNHEKSIEAAEFAISELNKNKIKKLKLKKLVRVNWLCASSSVFYLTIKASDNKFYEAVVYFKKDKRTMKFIRPARYYPEVNPEFLKFDAPGSGDAPGACSSGNAPGSSGYALGASGYAPGALGNAPGSSGNAPGSSGSASGASGYAPGASDYAPGASDYAPGASGYAPGASYYAPGAWSSNNAPYATF